MPLLVPTGPAGSVVGTRGGVANRRWVLAASVAVAIVLALNLLLPFV